MFHIDFLQRLEGVAVSGGIAAKFRTRSLKMLSPRPRKRQSMTNVYGLFGRDRNRRRTKPWVGRPSERIESTY
jgi:hypothetical protein